MKRFFLFLLCTVIGSVVVNADKVSVQQALQQALQFMPGKQFSPVKIADKAFARSDSNLETFYIFNAADKGYVIVSADDRTVPILGYSTIGKVDPDNMPDNLRYWLNCYAEQINGLGKTFQPERSSMTRADKPAIDPLIKATWNQNEPYNLQCPMDGEERSVTGCVATALAQAMYYYKWPASCPALPAYTTNLKSIPVSALPATTFKWDQMKDNYNSGETGAAADAVAELMRYCGQIFEMDYASPSSLGSAAYLYTDPVARYFNYSSEMQEVFRYYFSTSQWEELIYSELEAERPVLYGGSSASEGHQFICDGYDGSGLFHFNWGWGGDSDGYFVLSLANPDEKGIGGGSSSDGYTTDQSAIIGFRPATEGEVFRPEIVSYIGYIIPEQMAYKRPSIAENFVDVELSDFVGLHDYTQTDLSFEAGWGFWQNGTITCLASHECVIPTNEYFQENIVTASFGAGLPDGEYRLYQLYRMPGETEWHLCSSWESQYVIATISGTDLKLSYPSFEEEVTINDVSFIDPVVKKPINVTVNLTNTGTTMQEILFLWLKLNGEWEQVSIATGSVEPGQTGDVIMSFNTDKSGTFDVKITSDKEGKIILGTSSVTVAEFSDIEDMDESITISSAKQVAYCSDKDLDFSTMDDLKAYVATGYDKSTGIIWLTRVKDVPANTGFLLMGEAGEYPVPIKEGGSNAYYKNMFKGTIEATTIQTTETIDNKEYTNYYLSNGEQGVGFYKVTKPEGVALNANRAYLPIPSDIPAVGTAGGAETIKVSAAGQVPYYSANSLDFTDMPDVKAYTATGYDYEKGTIWLTRVKKVPALTGILIMAPEGSYPIPTVSVASIYENMFEGTLEGKTIQTTETIAGVDYINYYLSKGDYGVGFYKVGVDGVSLGANRCYLPIPKQSADTRGIDDNPVNFSIQESDEVIALRVFGSADGTTGIETKNRVPLTNNYWYNLQGQRIENPGKGIFIRNGKKIVIK